MSGNAIYQDLAAWADDKFRVADYSLTTLFASRSESSLSGSATPHSRKRTIPGDTCLEMADKS
jgi:hypothetical protein